MPSYKQKEPQATTPPPTQPNAKRLYDTKTFSVPGRNNHSAMLTSCGGLLNYFLF